MKMETTAPAATPFEVDRGGIPMAPFVQRSSSIAIGVAEVKSANAAECSAASGAAAVPVQVAPAGDRDAQAHTEAARANVETDPCVKGEGAVEGNA